MLPGIRGAGVVLGVLVCLAAGLSPALASCKVGICVSGSDNGNGTHTVRVSSHYPGLTHYNVIPPGHPQFEAHGNSFSFHASPGQVYTYSVQACRRHGLSRSVCSGWAVFRFGVPIVD